MNQSDYDEDGFEQRPNVRWENDFGPRTAMWKRYLMAFAAMAVVVLFFGFVIMGGLSSETAARETGGDRIWWFVGVLVLVVAIALGAESWALKLRGWLKK